MKKINSSYTEENIFEEIITQDMRNIGYEISNMSQKKFRRGDDDLIKYYTAFKVISEFYKVKNRGI